ncbi:MAG TPA: adenylate/guanylate cyclase domain-containing protein [Terrimicrobium sp.]
MNMDEEAGQLIRISYLPDAREVGASAGDTILQAALRAGIRLTHACGSNARCSTCRVAILEGLDNCSPRNEAEQAIAEHLEFKPMIRLACQTQVTGSMSARRLVLDDEDEELAVESMSDPLAEAAGEERHVAILFIDIRGFTAFAERLLPYDVIHALNRYYRQVGRIIHRHGGVIDNYMGDGILTIFGLAETDRAVSRALQAGLEVLEAVEAMKPYFRALHGRSFDIGIGLHYGAVISGTIGWGDYKRRTIVGDAVNFASRVEAANKTVGTNFLISEDAYDRAGHEVQVNQCPPWEIRGKTGVYQLYEVVGAKAI